MKNGPLRILYVHNSSDVYGASRSLVRLLQGLDRARFTPTVVLPCGGPLLERLREMGVDVLVYPALSIITRGVFHSWRLLPFLLNIPRSAFGLRRIVRAHWIDLVHTNTGVIISPALGAWLAGVPHVWHVRDSFQEFRKWWRYYAAFMRFFSAQIIAISEAVAAQFAQREKLVVIHNGLALEDYAVDRAALRREFRERHDIAPDALVVSCVGRIKLLRKGQEFLIQAAALLRARGRRAVFVIVGSPYSEFGSHLEQVKELARTLGIEHEVIFTGELADPRPVYAASEICVLPSAQPEPLGNVVMEAMIMGVPVIATNIGGPREQVVDGVTGFLVPPADPETLADKIERLLLDPELRERMGKAGEERVTATFPVRETVRKVEQIYTRVAGVADPARPRILYVHNGADLYGASRCLARMLSALDRAKYELLVVLPEDGPLRLMLEGIGVEVILHRRMSVITRPVFRSWRVLWFMCCFPFSVLFLALLIRRKHIALVHTNTGVILSPGPAARLAGVPHIWHIREWFGEFAPIWKLFSRYIVGCSEKILTMSTAVAEQFGPARGVSVLYDGLALEEFAVDHAILRRQFRTQFSLADDALVVGCVGRIKWVRKGQEILVQAAAILRQRGRAAKYLLVGSPFPGNEDHLQSLEKLVSDLDLRDEVIFAGEFADTRPAYAAMDVFVLPSINPEPFGMVVTEAMAMSLPVVATNVGGPLDQVAEGVSGFLVPPADPVALADKLEILLADAALRKRMGSAGRQRVAEQFTLEATARNVERVYAECLP